MYKKFFESRIRELWDLYSAIGNVEHRGEKGMLRELVLRRLLVSILPPHFGVGTGVIVDKWQRQSSQVDLIVYDRRFLPALLNENERGIFPIDIVLRVMEVKSILDKDGIHQTLDLAWQLNPGNPTGLKMAAAGKLAGGEMNYPLVGCFAYTSKINDPLACAKK